MVGSALVSYDIAKTAWAMVTKISEREDNTVFLELELNIPELTRNIRLGLRRVSVGLCRSLAPS